MARIRPESTFETTLSSALTAAASSISLATAPTETSGYMVIEPGTSAKEIIKYTGVSSTTLTGVTRGLALTGSSDAAGTGRAHPSGVKVSMTNVHYYMEQLVDKNETENIGGIKKFTAKEVWIGDATDTNETLYASNGDANKPYVQYNAATNKWLISNDGTTTYDITSGGSGLTASTGITLVASDIRVNPATDGGSSIESSKLKVIGVQDIQTAGETISGATTPVPVYLDNSDDRWYACDGNVQTKLEFEGFATTNATAGNTLTIQFSGIVSGFTGLNIGTRYYVQDAVGTLGSTVGTYECYVGIALSATELLIDKGPRAQMQYMGSAADAAKAITCPADARFAIVDMSVTGPIEISQFSVLISKIGKTSGTMSESQDAAGGVNLVTGNAAWASNTITLTNSDNATNISGTAYFYR